MKITSPSSTPFSRTALGFNLHVKEFKPEQIIFNKEKPVVKNENYVLYSGIAEEIGNVCLLPLSNYKENKDLFLSSISTINTMLNLKTDKFLKLFGFCSDNAKFTLIFEPVASNLEKIMNNITDEQRYSYIIDVMELILVLHDSNFQIQDIKPTNILLPGNSTHCKMIFPIENLSTFLPPQTEDDEMLNELINNEDLSIIRYTPPERLSVPPIIGNVNDIWMLGCLFIEIFSRSKVWKDQTETQIIKNLKALVVPKIPRDIKQSNWGIICECLNPFYKTRIGIKELFVRLYELLSKVTTRNDLIPRILGMSSLKDSFEKINVNVNDFQSDTNKGLADNEMIVGEESYLVRRCYSHPKFNIDSFCLRCNEAICSKCKHDMKHSDHIEDIKPIKDFVDDTEKQIEIFKVKFENFVDENSRNFPIDDTVKLYVNKQRDVIHKLTQDQIKFINYQFDLFHKQIDTLKQIEDENVQKMKNFFISKLNEFEESVNTLNNEVSRIKTYLATKIENLKNFPKYDLNKKCEIIRGIPLDKETLRNDKKEIMQKFKDYHFSLNQCEKTKRYYHRMLLNIRESKPYQFIKALAKLNTQLDTLYRTQNLNDILSNVIIDIDNFSLVNSRNYISPKFPYINIACFNSNKVLGFDIPNHTLSVNDIDFSDVVSEKKFPIFSRSVNVNELLYINGGFDEEQKVSKKTHLRYNAKENSLVELCPMINGHSAHSIIYVQPKSIIAVSGSGTFKCESYDIMTDKWTEISEINYQRQNATLFVYNEMYLFAFGGLYYDEIANDFVFVETVERFEIDFDEKTKWEIVPAMKTRNNVNISKSVMTAVPIHPNKILLVGGMLKDQSYSDDVLLFDFEKNEFSLCEDVKLEKKACFPSKHFLFLGDYGFQFDNEGDIHEFDVKECRSRVVTPKKSIA